MPFIKPENGEKKLRQNIIDLLNPEGLKIFGKVNASISHELKNIFAIISETTGFLNDLTQLARQGKKFDLAILENCNKSIAEEIERGFNTIRQMNKFAHSVDDPVKKINVGDSLELAINLASFLSDAKPVKIVAPQTEVLVVTCPFLLQNLIYQVLCCIYKSTQDGEITIQLEPPKNMTVHLIFSGESCQFSDHLSLPDLKKIIDSLSINIKTKYEPFELEMIIPVEVDL
jgi:C4-dicarboxylate-specific signal transduction histidine kinase